MRTVALIVLAACGSTTPRREAPATRSLPEVPFGQLDHDQRHEFMELVVMPAMETMFKDHDPQRFADFGCVTCHGKRSLDGDHHMPNAELPKLDFADLSKWSADDLEWMREVKPAMAQLLRRPVWTEDNPTGFGCEGCHPTVE